TRPRNNGHKPVKQFTPPDTPAPTGSSVECSTLLGGSGDDSIQAIAIGTATTPGFVYVAGFTDSTDFPLTEGANFPSGDPAAAACIDIATPAFPCGDAFVAKFDVSNIAAVQLVAVTLIGGSGDDVAWGLALDSSDNPYIVGETNSGDFPTTGNGN